MLRKGEDWRMDDVIIIGAGVAGLAAAEALECQGVHATILEARDRIGGRINTVDSRVGNLPVELGAEFIHGAKNDLWEVIRAAGLQTEELPDRHWQLSEGGLQEDSGFWDE